MKWRTNPGRSPEATLLSTNLSNGHLLLWPPLGAEISQDKKNLPSQAKVSLPVGREPVFFLCSGVYPWDLEMLQDPLSPRGKKEAEVPSICAESRTLSTVVASLEE